MSTGCELSCKHFWMKGPTMFAITNTFSSRHDYSDDDCVKILERLKPRMLENPRTSLLVNEVVVPTLPTLRGSENKPISEAKPQRQSSFVEVTSVMQLHSVAMQGGLERTYQDFEAIFKRAGFCVHHFYQLQFFTAIIEIAPDVLASKQ